MHRDYRIMAQPYRGARRIITMKSGFATRKDAEAFLKLGQDGGWLSPRAYVTVRHVSEAYCAVDYTIPAQIAAGCRSG